MNVSGNGNNKVQKNRPKENNYLMYCRFVHKTHLNNEKPHVIGVSYHFGLDFITNIYL